MQHGHAGLDILYAWSTLCVQLSGVRMRVTSLEGELNQAKALHEAVEKDFNRVTNDLAAVSCVIMYVRAWVCLAWRQRQQRYS